MFSFFSKKVRLKALFAGLVLLFIAGSLFISCSDDNGVSVDTQKPSITTQPIGGNWNVTTDTTFHLAVTASVTDGGTLSYQWYKNTTNSTNSGTAIGTDSRTHNLDKTGYTVGEDHYFYVVVTNTNNSVDGNKTATTTSNVVKVEVRDTGITGGNDPDLEDLPVGLAGFFQTVFSNIIYYSYTASIQGFYVDGFHIDSATKTFYYYQDSTLETYWYGHIEGVAPESGSEPARLIIKITGVQGSFYSTPETGKYLVYAYKNLAGGMVSTAVAYNMSGNKNTGVDSISDAISEYTDANGYYDYFGTYETRPFTSSGLNGVKGDWYGDPDEWDEDYRIHIRGTTFTEFYDDYEAGSIGSYNPTDDDFLQSVGLIEDCTDTSQSSGILYVRSFASDMGVDNWSYYAVAWRNKSGNEIEFATSTTTENSLSGIKGTYGNISVFPDGSFYLYNKD